MRFLSRKPKRMPYPSIYAALPEPDFRPVDVTNAEEQHAQWHHDNPFRECAFRGNLHRRPDGSLRISVPPPPPPPDRD